MIHNIIINFDIDLNNEDIRTIQTITINNNFAAN